MSRGVFTGWSRDSFRVSLVGRFVKNAWNKEPVITVSCGIGLLGEGDINAHYSSQYASSSSCCMNLRSVCVVFSACALPALSPLTKYTGMMNQAVPYNYPGISPSRSLCMLDIRVIRGFLRLQQL